MSASLMSWQCSAIRRARPRIGAGLLDELDGRLELRVGRAHLDPRHAIGVVGGALDDEPHRKAGAVDLDAPDQLHASDNPHALGGAVQTRPRNPR